MGFKRKYKCDICKKRYPKEDTLWTWTQVDWFVTCKNCSARKTK